MHNLVISVLFHMTKTVHRAFFDIAARQQGTKMAENVQS